MPSFQGVAAGQTATLRLPIGLTYHKLLVSYSGVTLANMTEVRVVINGKAVQTYKGADQLNAINQYCGMQAASGTLVIDFERYKLLTRAARDVTVIGTGANNDPTPVTTLALEIDIASGASSPALSARAIQSAPTNLGTFIKTKQFNYAPSSAGEYQISDLPKGDLINKIYFNGGGNISQLEVHRNGYEEFNRKAAENNLVQSNGIRNPQTGWFVYDPTEDGAGSETLATSGVQDLRFTMHMSASANVQVVAEYIGPMGSL